jgi:hypothetical protein
LGGNGLMALKMAVFGRSQRSEFIKLIMLG